MKSTLYLALSTLAVLIFTTAAFAGDDWRPIVPSELASKTPVVDKDADAEALFWDVRIKDGIDGEMPRTVLNHYVRIKIYTEKGKDAQSQVAIRFFNGTKITDIEGRTIKVDGSTVPLKKEDIFEQTEVKLNGLKLKVKKFAMAGVEPGAIIEYRWREIREDQLANYIRFQLQLEVPVQRVTYHLKPLAIPEYGMRYKSFHTTDVHFEKEKDGFYAASLGNMPAYKEESRMPPEDEVRAWFLIYYTKELTPDPASFWSTYGKAVYESNKSGIKPNDEVKAATAKAIEGATTPEEKLDRIFNYCRENIKNVNYSASGLSIEEREKAKTNKSAGDTLKRGTGTTRNIDQLFAAMAIAAGFDARMANMADRGDAFFDPSFPDDYFIRTYDIAVKVGDQWRFYDPGSRYVPSGMLLWREEGEKALISDPKNPEFVTTPMSGPEKSVEKRTGTFKLDEEGTLEGDATIEYTGHLAIDKKNANDDDSPAQREQTLIDGLKARMPSAEVTKVSVENVTDQIKPFIYKFHIRVPGYAQRTGKRLFLQPEFFQHGIGPAFSSSARIYPVYFHYPWSEVDDVTIELPAGYALDSADAPQGFSSPNVSEYKVTIGVATDKDSKAIHYKRSFYFGKGGNLLFPQNAYSPVKGLFDELNKRDNHTITLKASATSASTTNP